MSGRNTARHVDAAPGWAQRRFREQDAKISALQVGKISVVPGSTVTIQQLSTDPNSTLAWIDTDQVVYSGTGDVALSLSALPYSRTLIVMQNGDPLAPSEWTRTGPLVTVPAQTWFHADDVFSAYYATDTVVPDQQVPGPVITSPLSGAATTDTTPTLAGTGAEGRTITVLVDGAGVGTTVVSGGVWSLTLSAALSLTSHVALAEQAEPSGGSRPSTPVTFLVTGAGPLTSLTVRGKTEGTGGLPPETVVGDFVVIATRDTTTTYSDDRFPLLSTPGTESRVYAGIATDTSPLVPIGTGGIVTVTAFVGGASVNAVNYDTDPPSPLSVAAQPGSAAVAVVSQRSSWVAGGIGLSSPWTLAANHAISPSYGQVSLWYWIDTGASSTPAAAPTTSGAVDESEVFLVTLLEGA